MHDICFSGDKKQNLLSSLLDILLYLYKIRKQSYFLKLYFKLIMIEF